MIKSQLQHNPQVASFRLRETGQKDGKYLKILRPIVLVAMVLAFVVIVLGAYTRLTDAGLGCPDWPGCYGHLVLPAQSHDLAIAQTQYPAVPIESRKAWTEMVHRYAAGSLAILVMLIAGVAWRYRRQGAPTLIPLLLVCLIGCQAALGMWTVTLKLLPVVVMGHLLGGLLIFAHLVYLYWQLQAKPGGGRRQGGGWVNLGLGIVFCQIALGGWVSSNYAGLACIGFPRCNGLWLPMLEWQKSFQLWTAIGTNYQGGVLDNVNRVTIQMAHRLGAMVTVLYLVGLAFTMLWRHNNILMRRWVTLLLICLTAQFSLGMANVLYLLPLGVAVAHNGVAALLLATMVSLRYHFIGTKDVCRA